MSNVVSKISVTLEGMMMLFVNEEASICRVGILKHAPMHEASIEIFKITDGKRTTLTCIKGSDFKPRMRLKIRKAVKRIILFHGENPIDRQHDTGDEADFDWVLDFEGNDMYEAGLEVTPAGFKSILTINDGIFSTSKRSGDNLILKKKNTADHDVGKVAVRIAVDITLTGHELADFFNGGDKTPLRVAKNTDYEIAVKQVRPQTHRPSDEESDAENFYTAVQVDVPCDERFHFERGRDRNDPDARCMTPYAGQSDFNG